MKARVSQLHKTEAGWNDLPDFTPLAGEFVVFDVDDQHDYIRLKIGDGVMLENGKIVGTKLKDLPFFNEILDAGRVTKYKK